MPRVHGIHHVTAIAGDPQENLDFYAGVLGLRLVKRSVNQDDPGTYHLFYADGEGRPGTDITFFPWPSGRQGGPGAGMINEVAFSIPPGSLGYWQDHLEGHGVEGLQEGKRFGEPALTFQDPHGMALAAVASERAVDRPFTPWGKSPVPEDHQLRGFESVRVLERRKDPTTAVVTEVLGLEEVATDGPWRRYQGTDPQAGFLEVQVDPGAPTATGGVGTVHHVAWQAGDEAREREIRQQVLDHGLQPTGVIDRHWFKSVYFREPGGVLFELATDEPGFTVDEPLEALGQTLVLPPWLEDQREKIEGALPSLQVPYEAQG